MCCHANVKVHWVVNWLGKESGQEDASRQESTPDDPQRKKQRALEQLILHTYQFRVFNDGQPGVIVYDPGHGHVCVDVIELEKIRDPLVRFAMDRVHAHDGVRVERESC